MSVNPMTYQELDAFSRRCLVDLSAWEVEVLMRVDDAVVTAVHESAPTVTASGDPSPPAEVTADDGAGGKAMFRSLAARKSKK